MGYRERYYSLIEKIKKYALDYYGDIDFIPSEEYTRDDALRAISDVKKVLDVACRVVPLRI